MDPGPAHISGLHEDILHHIFELNADMYLEGKSSSLDNYSQTPSNRNNSALNVIRHTSQVCQYWRGLIISSPMIWGNIIDFNLLQQVNNFWRKEVIRRTGNSNLSVKGMVKCKGSTGEFFADLMKNHWLRIRKLDVKIHHYRLLDDETWKALQHPAPHLELFKVDIAYWGHDQIFPTASPSLFSDEAPSLREFRFTYYPGINGNFTLRAPWLCQLRSVTLIETFTISDILDALMDMPLLESLELQKATVGAAAPRRCVHLPHLSLMTINSTSELRGALLVLESIVAKPACALVLDTFDGNIRGVNLEDIIAVQKIILRYALGYFSSELMVVEGLTFRHHPKAFSLHYSPLKTSAIHQKPSGFEVDIFFNFPVTPEFFGTLQDSPFPSLHVKTWDMRQGMLEDIEGEISYAGWESLTSFLSLFPFVEVLQAPEYSLRVLLSAFEEDPGVWSLLHTLKITYYIRMTPSFSGNLIRFLDRREGNGLAIKVLDITELAARENRDWGFLERKAGLKVVWAQDGSPLSYICGSGEPEKLIIYESSRPNANI
ncbi:hypothetical protein GALMADRAFT_135548 [Galerina marginata CBS 339.88]|uniref:F-box domain-containing protein n=1 Tax=Galerina marginata (strain CBS 339.88) TaxID=685588 RepID=A0A067TGA0_GALM3|nr:hypothetical protein GALMADRAFT_135548 [Galerina marginata CBS 339.88]